MTDNENVMDISDTENPTNTNDTLDVVAITDEVHPPIQPNIVQNVLGIPNSNGSSGTGGVPPDLDTSANQAINPPNTNAISTGPIGSGSGGTGGVQRSYRRYIDSTHYTNDDEKDDNKSSSTGMLYPAILRICATLRLV